MRITIAIPTFNRAESLAETLCSVRALVIPEGTSCEVLVVDNGSTDGTQRTVAEMASSFPMPLRSVIEIQPGLCFGRNRALGDAEGEHVVYLDDDIDIARGWLVGYTRAVIELGADCVVGPVVPVFPEDLPPYATRLVLSLVDSDYSRKGSQRHVLGPEVAHEIPGCNFGTRRDVALAIGGFDNTLDRVGAELLAGGDTEFGIRLVKARKRVVYEPDCRIDHFIPVAKLEQEYLRRRAKGLGMTGARLRSIHGPRRGVRRWLRDFKQTAGLWARWQKHRALGNTIDAFEWELRTQLHAPDLVATLLMRMGGSHSVAGSTGANSRG